MRAYDITLNICILFCLFVCIATLILQVLDIQLFFFRHLVNVDIVALALCGVLGGFYAKWILSRYLLTRKVSSIFLWVLPVVLAPVTLLLLLELGRIPAVVIPLTLLLFAVLCLLRVPWKKVLCAVTSYWALCAALVIPLGMALFLSPALNDNYEVYDGGDKTYVHASGGFLAVEWTTVYVMTSPITMVKVDEFGS